MKTNFTYITFKQIEEWQNRPLEDKVTAAADIINEALGLTNNQAIAFSGGKNSLVALHIILKFKPDIKVVFCNTGVEYPQSLKFTR
ncbi:hypothetical protein DRP07_00790, partial [Archaeoglobales archaeon]